MAKFSGVAMFRQISTQVAYLPALPFREDLAVRRDVGPSRRRVRLPRFGLCDIRQRGELKFGMLVSTSSAR